MRLCTLVCVVFIREYTCTSTTRAHMRVSVRICPRLRRGSARLGRPPSPLPFRVRALLGRCFRDVCWGLLLGTAPQPALMLLLPPPQSFGRIRKWLEHARSSPSLTVLAGGKCDDSVGYFVEPCIVESKDPQEPIMKEVVGQQPGCRRVSLTRAQRWHRAFAWHFFSCHYPISRMRN